MDILAHLDEKPRVSDCFRLGTQNPGGKRPIIFMVSSPEAAQQIQRKASGLKTVEGYSRIYINPHRAFEQRLVHRALVQEVKKKQDSEPDKHHFIRMNRVIE